MFDQYDANSKMSLLPEKKFKNRMSLPLLGPNSEMLSLSSDVNASIQSDSSVRNWIRTSPSPTHFRVDGRCNLRRRNSPSSAGVHSNDLRSLMKTRDYRISAPDPERLSDQGGRTCRPGRFALIIRPGPDRSINEKRAPSI